MPNLTWKHLFLSKILYEICIIGISDFETTENGVYHIY